MTTIFMSGSREIPYLPEEFRYRIDRIMAEGYDVVVGDSNRGVDARVIEYLAKSRYERVSIYTIHESPRVKGLLEGWTICHVATNCEKKVSPDGSVKNARELETEKDKAMGEIADYGLVAWCSAAPNRFGKLSASKGSLRNMHQLLLAGKPVVLYRVEAGGADDGAYTECLTLKTLNDLDAVVEGCPDVVKRAYATIVKANESTLF